MGLPLEVGVALGDVVVGPEGTMCRTVDSACQQLAAGPHVPCDSSDCGFEFHDQLLRVHGERVVVEKDGNGDFRDVPSLAAKRLGCLTFIKPDVSPGMDNAPRIQSPSRTFPLPVGRPRLSPIGAFPARAECTGPG